ncbi:uncharacterized protein K452DRAFT_309353 [Aplosporella prunicola CBS 121167]|uniref:BZIP domain-containing protein n=1 Tax=Aplosporella prunicola CBS 121167 TaxID=1176127 RepID=A0A6A6B9K1_9PEZI|nr:uncharacterized protein K452DRAFT_309353 [Aplosporella prunicola CBS 121167]KAF2140889.1 hypothetical protein K452DRAFT_309353 [Aplosporella prunicola CBS 121167]
MSRQHGTGSGPSSATVVRPSPARSHTTPSGPRFELPMSRGPALPPIHPPADPAPPRSEGRTPRALGVHSILNPPQAEAPEAKGQRRTAAEMESPSPVDRFQGPTSNQGGYFGGHHHHHHHHAHDASRRPQSQVITGDSSQRRILSPRSPLFRSHSLNRIRAPTGTISAQETPFLSPNSREYMVEPGSAPNPPLPTPPAAQRAGHSFPPPPPVPTPPINPGHSRQTSANFSHLSHSASASPSMAPYGPGALNSPAQPLGELPRPRSPAPYSPVYHEAEHRPFGIPVASTGQSNYQLLTLETNQGHVQIPVDVQAASKMADEKRKRNAGASARFRARRKEKEKEASTTISRLEQQLRDATEDMEFYRRERDYLAQVVYNSPGGDRHFPRPPSPHRRRVSLQTSSGSGASAASTPGAYSNFPSDQPSQPQRVAETERNVRRRTSSYLPAPQAAQQQPSSMPFPPTSYPPLVAASSVSGSRTPPILQQPPPPPPPPHQPGFSSPYAFERPDRSWPPTSAPGRPGPL